MLIQWLYRSQALFNESSPTEIIPVIIEFVRLADIIGVTMMESPMAGYIKTIILASPAQEYQGIIEGQDVVTNTYFPVISILFWHSF
jgi:hypothetical protein